MDVGASFVADSQAAEADEPRQGAFHDPAVTAQALTPLDPAARDAGHDPAFPAAVERGTMPIQLPGPFKAFQQSAMERRPNPYRLPVTQPPPERHARATAHLLRQGPSGKASAQHEQNAVLRSAIRDGWPTTLRARSGRWQEWRDHRPKIIGDKGLSHAPSTHQTRFC